MKKLMALALTLILALGCMGAFAEETTEIYFLNFKPEIAEVYEEIAATYEAETGVHVNVVTAAAGTYEQTLRSEIAKADAPTIFQINGPVGLQSWKDYCLDLADTEFYNMLSDKTLAVTEGDAVYGIPYVVEATASSTTTPSWTSTSLRRTSPPNMPPWTRSRASTRSRPSLRT